MSRFTALSDQNHKKYHVNQDTNQMKGVCDTISESVASMFQSRTVYTMESHRRLRLFLTMYPQIKVWDSQHNKLQKVNFLRTIMALHDHGTHSTFETYTDLMELAAKT